MTAITEPIRTEVHVTEPYSRLRLAAGILGRSWLWFLGACLLVSILPLAIGWKPYVIITGSMEPGIGAGDVVLVSPSFDPSEVVGRVISFEDPGRPGHVLTHRVMAIDEGGNLITKGDANPTNDSVPVPPEAVTGLGRVLVRFVGLPVVWLRAGDYLPLLAHLALVVGAVVATVLDHEPTGPGRRPWQSRIRQHQPADPSRLLTRRAPSVTLLVVFGLLAALNLATRAAPTSAAAFAAVSTNSGDRWAVPNWAYATEVIALAPYLYWKLDETGTAGTAADSSGNGRTGTYNPSGAAANFSRLADGALVTDTPDRAVQLVNANACINTTSATSIAAPQLFTVIVWFRAPASYSGGGKMLGFERPQTGTAVPTAGAYDRHLFMDGQGRVWFGVYNNGHVALSSGTGLNDNQWHMAVGTQSAAGMRLYIDGAQVGSNGNTVAETQNGWWRAGCGNLAGWGGQWGGSNNPGTASDPTQNRPFLASLDEATVYSGTALTAQQVAFLYWAR
ncbi:MAG TPA: signal peptidase I [Acidimicrobiia bacterium]|jgi:signal peptidase I